MKKLILLSALLFSTVHAADLTVKADALTTNNPAKTIIDVKKNVDIQSTGGLYLPSGTTAQQPSPYKDGMLRYNSTLGTAEIYSGGVWGEVGGSTTIADWVASTDYEAGEFVIESLKLYRALLNHTASLSFSADLIAGDWEEISPTGTINLATGVTGILPISNGGTGSASKNFVDLTTNQTVAGNKTFVNDLTVNGITSLASSLTGPLKAVGGVVSSGNINAATELTGITPIANGGTGNASGTATINANLTGEVTSVGNAATVTNDAVIAKTLTGFASGAGTVTSADSLLQAAQKLDGNVALKLGNTKSDVDGSSVVTTELQAPNDQLTTTDTNKRRIETGNQNMLADPEMEGINTSAFTATGGTQALSKTSVAGEYSSGKKALKIALAASALDVSQTALTPSGIQKQGYVRLLYKIPATITDAQICSLVDAAEQNCVPSNKLIANGLFNQIEIPLIFGATSAGWKIKTTATYTQDVFIDNVILAQGLGTQNLMLDSDYSAQISSSCVVSGENKDWINGNGTLSSTSNCAIVFNTGLVTQAMNCTASSRPLADVGGNTIFFIANSSTGFTTRGVQDGTSAAARDITVRCQKSGNDYLAASASVYSSTAAGAVSAYAYGTPAAWAANDPIIYPTEAYDTNNAYNTTTGRFQVPQSGYYQVSVFNQSNNAPYDLYVSRNASGTLGPGAVNIVSSSAGTINKVGGTAAIYANKDDFLDIRQSTVSGTTGPGSVSFTKITSSNTIVGSFAGYVKVPGAENLNVVQYSGHISQTGVTSNLKGSFTGSSCSLSASTFTCNLTNTHQTLLNCTCSPDEAPTAASLNCYYDFVNSTPTVAKFWTTVNGTLSARQINFRCDGNL